MANPQYLQNIQDLIKGFMAKKPRGFQDNLVSNVIPMSLGIGAVGAIASRADEALDTAKGAVGDLKYSLSAEKKIDRLIELQPVLSQYDRSRVRLYYEQLREFSPGMAENDLAAASYVKHTVSLDDSGVPPIVIGEITKTQKNISDAIPRKFPGLIGKGIVSGSTPTMVGSEPYPNFRPFFPNAEK